MSGDRNSRLPDDAARAFGLEILGKIQPILALPLNEVDDAILESLGRIAFKLARQIGGQMDAGEG